MKITERDKKILYILCALLLVFCAYYFGYRNLTSKNDSLDSDISVLQSKYNSLKIMEAGREKYKKDTKNYEDSLSQLLNSYDSGYSQEYSILFLKELEDQTGVWLKQSALNATVQIYEFGKNNSTNPEKNGQKAYASSYLGYKTTMNLSYECSYKELKKLIDYINTYKFKCSMDALTMTYNADSDTVSGTMVLNQFAIVGADRNFPGAYIKNLVTGTDNIFDSSVFSGGTATDVTSGNSILSDYDYYMTLQPSTADVDALVIGAKNDTAGTQTISAKENSYQDVTIRFAGSKGNYTVQYKIGNISYPSKDYDKGHSFMPGEMLSLLVISSQRTGVDDLSGAHVTLINDSDKELFVKTVNEDQDNPRFVVNDKQGKITIYD